MRKEYLYRHTPILIETIPNGSNLNQKGVLFVNEIAIASVPIQPWEQPYETTQALYQGTIFPCLYKPFFIVEQMSQTETLPQGDCESLLLDIQKISFSLVDITLYLDTHPDDQEALTLRNNYRMKRKELLQEFASNYYPLTPDCEGLWSDGPMPWEAVV